MAWGDLGPLPPMDDAMDMGSSSIADTLANVNRMRGILDEQNTQAKMDPLEIEQRITPDGQIMLDVKNVDKQMWAQLMGAIQFQKNAVQGAQEEFDKIKQQEQNLSHGMGPIFNVLATVGGNLATADPRLPPVVRALGQSAKELNPTLPQIQARKMAAASELSRLGGNLADTELGAFRETRLNLKNDQADALANKRFMLSFVAQKGTDARQGLYDPSDAGSLADELKRSGAIPNEEDALKFADGLIKISQNKRERLALEQKQKLDLEDKKHLDELDRQDKKNAFELQKLSTQIAGQFESASALLDKKLAAEKEMAGIKAQKLTPFEEKDLQAGTTAIRSLREIRKLIQDNPQYQGLSRYGNLGNVVSPELLGSKGYQEFQKGLMRKLTAAKDVGGVRAFNPTEWSAVFAKYLPDPSKSQQANLAAVDSLEAEARLKVAGLGELLTARDVDLSKYPIFKEANLLPGSPKAVPEPSKKDSAEFLAKIPPGKKARITSGDGTSLGIFENRNGAMVRVGD